MINRKPPHIEQKNHELENSYSLLMMNDEFLRILRHSFSAQLIFKSVLLIMHLLSQYVLYYFL